MATLDRVLIGTAIGGGLSFGLVVLLGQIPAGPNGDAFVGRTMEQIQVFVASSLFTVPIGIAVAFRSDKSKDE